MTIIAAVATDDAASLCAQEPIHIPGAIQPHGALLAAQAEGAQVTYASANLAAILGRSAASVLGRPLAEALGETASHELLGLGAGLRDGATIGQVLSLRGPDGAALNLQSHRAGQQICIDIEPTFPEAARRPPLTQALAVLESFKGAANRGELCELAVRGLKAITGYDRVVAYRFGKDGHGEVVAEAVAEGVARFLGQLYPATDIPAQARRQYLRQPVGGVANCAYQPVPLLAWPALSDGTPLDLTHSSLRSVSPLHREFMRNMKTAASLTIGLAHGQSPNQPTLWGMLICHHAVPRVAGPQMRAVASVIGQVVSLLLGSLGAAEFHDQMLTRDFMLQRLVDRLHAPQPLIDNLAAMQEDMLNLVDATGAVVRFAGTTLQLGRTPAPPDALQALAEMQLGAGCGIVAIDDLGLRHPALARCTSEGSGALMVPLGEGAGDAILWFRPERTSTVTWGGNPSEHDIALDVGAGISPRSSFGPWKEVVGGHSVAWTEADLALAHALRLAIEAEVARRTQAALALIDQVFESAPTALVLTRWGGRSPRSIDALSACSATSGGS